jgi:plasmid replication initiation protein
MNGENSEILRKLEERRMERAEAFRMGDLDAYKRLEPPLLPDQDPTQHYFVCDILDAKPKDDLGSMEYPMFSLSKSPDQGIRQYEYNGHQVTIVPGGYGLATIWDKDILIYCTSQLVAAQERGKPISRTLWVKGNDLLKAIKRGTDGRNCANIKAALNRLSGTRITTDISTNGKRISAGFGLIDRWQMVTAVDDPGRTIGLEIVISEWLYNAILSKEVLSIPSTYFELSKALERRLYELARKHCGKQSGWKVSLDKLYVKAGSTCNINEFRRQIKEIVKDDLLPDYRLGYDPNKDAISVYRRTAKGALKQVQDILDQPRRQPVRSRPRPRTSPCQSKPGKSNVIDHPCK